MRTAFVQFSTLASDKKAQIITRKHLVGRLSDEGSNHDAAIVVAALQASLSDMYVRCSS